MTKMNDPFQLQRFIDAQQEVYDRALAELKSGQKRSHWMWYIFPQLQGLGASATSRFYAIKSYDEAQAYLQNTILGPRLEECTQTLLSIEGRTILEIFGSPDHLKLKSCMTLFELVAPAGSSFSDVLNRMFASERDVKTLALLAQLNKR